MILLDDNFAYCGWREEGQYQSHRGPKLGHDFIERVTPRSDRKPQLEVQLELSRRPFIFDNLEGICYTLRNIPEIVLLLCWIAVSTPMPSDGIDLGDRFGTDMAAIYGL